MFACSAKIGNCNPEFINGLVIIVSLTTVSFCSKTGSVGHDPYKNLARSVELSSLNKGSLA